MLIVFFSKTAPRPEFHSFIIDMRDLCDNIGSKCDYLYSSGNYGYASVYAVVDDNWLPHVDKTYIGCSHLYSFLWVSSGLRYVPYDPVSVSSGFIILSTVCRWPTMLTPKILKPIHCSC